jgi:radical SAM protein with 4Fe4S-binding SPASM domain
MDRTKRRELRFKPGVMDFGLFKKAIDQITDFPDRLKKLALYMRGEPLMHQRLADMIAYAKAKKVSDLIQVTTNGILLSPQMNRKLIEAGLDELVVSVQALSSSKYKELTKVSVDYEKFRSNIRDFYQNKENCNVYIKILDIGLEPAEEQLFHQLYDDICDRIFIEHVLPQYRHVAYGKVDSEFSVDVRGDRLANVAVCSQPFLSLYVLHNGDICVCCVDYSGRLVFGNLAETSLVDIWMSRPLNEFRIMQLKKERYYHFECSKCEYPIYNTPEKDLLDKYRLKILPLFSVRQNPVD